MYQFSRWKYWLVIIVVVSGTLFALPNVFGEGPALQLSRNDRVAMDQAAQQRVLGVLEAQKIAPEVSYLEKDRLVLALRRRRSSRPRRATPSSRALRATTWSRCRACRARRSGCGTSA